MSDENDKIYVQIPSFLDTELCPTIRSLYAMATKPHRLRVAVLWQHDDGETIDNDVLSLPNLDIVAVDARLSEGPNWARRQLRARWTDEQFTLLLDSHHRFLPGWDEQLVAMHRSAGLQTERPEKAVLTSYLSPYRPGVPLWNFTPRALRLIPHEREDGILTRLAGWPIPFASSLICPVPAEFVSLHLLFGAGTFNAIEELSVLDDIYFFGDEVLLSLLLISLGFDLFHPHIPIGWHAYDRTQRQPHWTRSSNWSDQHRASLNLVRSYILDAGSDRSAISRSAVELVERNAMTHLVTTRAP